ncbi:MAG: hypothetical protein FJX34_04935 [Alphaproteobacteria bacterium]|nr:hypothetical protein [Alphaproteobacteria bacterium]
MIAGIFKKLFRAKSNKNSKDDAPNFADGLRSRADKLTDFLGERFEFAKKEYFIIKDKMRNLREANYQLGLRHLEKGEMRDAIFRFRFIKRFWPDLWDAYYQLGYCLVLDKRPKEAKLVLEELLKKNPAYDSKAQELLDNVST